MKKVVSLFLAIFFIFSFSNIITLNASYNSELDAMADIVLLMSLDDGSIIFDKNADKITAPASLTKITTAILTLEHCKNLDEMVTVKKYCITELNGTGSSMAGLLPDEQISVRNLLYCMLVHSANEAANILADYVAGSIDAFIPMMNDLSVRLGCTNTQYVNAHGLDAEGHYSTAKDLAIITKYALSLPNFLEICSTVRYVLPATNKSPARNIVTTNQMQNPSFKGYYCDYIQGIKTGTTDNAGKCVISKASKDGYNYLAIVMGAPYIDINNDTFIDNVAFVDCKKMLDWTFKNIKLKKIADPTQIAKVSAVKRAWGVDHIRLVPEKEVSALVPVGTNENSVQMQIIEAETPSVVKAPIKKGDILGKAKILYAETEIATINLVAAEDIKVSGILLVFDFLKNVFSSLIFQILAGVTVLLLLIYLSIIIRHNNKKKRRRKKVRVVKDFRDINR
ncbi:MAG: D-alanyl-D-alanine carboxypeptidase family protein [Oscillospiraceae bacterium]